MALLILVICSSFAYSASQLDKASPGEIRLAVRCRMRPSLDSWKEMAQKAKDTADKAVGVPQQVMSSLHDFLKGSADVIEMIDEKSVNMASLSQEGFHQLNQWFITYPVQVGKVLGNLASRFPNFARTFHKVLQEIQEKADGLTLKVLNCKPK